MEKLLKNVKVELGITINSELIDKNIILKINAVKGYLRNGEAKIDINNISGETLPCIAIRVNDLLNSKTGETKSSPAFNMLAMQICRRRLCAIY